MPLHNFWSEVLLTKTFQNSYFNISDPCLNIPKTLFKHFPFSPFLFLFSPAQSTILGPIGSSLPRAISLSLATGAHTSVLSSPFLLPLAPERHHSPRARAALAPRPPVSVWQPGRRESPFHLSSPFSPLSPRRIRTDLKSGKIYGNRRFRAPSFLSGDTTFH